MGACIGPGMVPMLLPKIVKSTPLARVEISYGWPHLHVSFDGKSQLNKALKNRRGICFNAFPRWP